ncbi:hypothetical protein LAZ67_21001929, partial [Cordylochernes scorpioides]
MEDVARKFIAKSIVPGVLSISLPKASTPALEILIAPPINQFLVRLKTLAVTVATNSRTRDSLLLEYPLFFTARQQTI